MSSRLQVGKLVTLYGPSTASSLFSMKVYFTLLNTDKRGTKTPTILNVTAFQKLLRLRALIIAAWYYSTMIDCFFSRQNPQPLRQTA